MGAQTIIAFVLSSGIALSASLLGHTLQIVPQDGDENIIDRAAARLFRKFINLREDTRRACDDVLTKIVLSLSDQQLVRGLAILVIGFIQHCTITVYHFSIIGDLTWFAVGTHNITLNILEAYPPPAPFAARTARFLHDHHVWFDAGLQHLSGTCRVV